MKAKELRKKYRIIITGMMMAALLAGTTACSTQASDTSSPANAAESSTVAADAAEEALETGESAAATETGENGLNANAADSTDAVDTGSQNTAAEAKSGPSKDEITTTETIENSEDGGHAIIADAEEQTYANTAVTKTGDSDSGDEADFYGDNAAIFATNGGTLNLSEMVIETNGTHANSVFQLRRRNDRQYFRFIYRDQRQLLRRPDDDRRRDNERGESDDHDQRKLLSSDPLRPRRRDGDRDRRNLYHKRNRISGHLFHS